MPGGDEGGGAQAVDLSSTQRSAFSGSRESLGECILNFVCVQPVSCL